MKTVRIVTPPRAASNSGNRVSADRWAGHLRDLGYRVTVRDGWNGEPADILFALHAKKSAAVVARFARAHPAAAIVVALTGTDLYHDLAESPAARRTLDLAHRILVLQPRALRALPPRWRKKARVVLQSVPAPKKPARRLASRFEVAVVCHLRPVKDPLRAALAARLLPASSGIVLVHAGAALTPALAARARRESAANARYHWLGEQTRAATLRLIARARLLVVTSHLEGGANVVSEAIVAGTPVLSTRIDGSIGLLGERYPGYFPVSDDEALARLLLRAENDARFYRRLVSACARLAPRFRPDRERDALERLLDGPCGAASP
jgi:putative glycosyltransferase (TIGR04348 family)